MGGKTCRISLRRCDDCINKWFWLWVSAEAIVVAVSCRQKKRKNQTGSKSSLKYYFEGHCDDKVAKE